MLTGKYRRALDKTIGTICTVLMVLLVVCVTWQVFSRYILNQPSTFTDELARFSMIWTALLGTAYCVGTQQHLAIDLLTSSLKGRKKFFNEIYINATILGFAAFVMVFGGLKLLITVHESNQLSPAMQIPMSFIYIVLPLSGAITCLYSTVHLIQAIKNFANPELAEAASKES
ncbi:TRAP transporter small permease [Rhodobacteraceae bacterium RKSG542]|uniref:TRAP transporter small permease n=1 Tax=Pseudovibrio flavus TaxID=2529854 RepID=UPI0012BC7E3C|nr:TRAP transporter small permease [Pseudovibrio flavus]MTI18019.1 TRAP transporter small permease [Pseudovibrio flavus]